MTIRHLNVFLTVFQTENVTKAAELLYMTQPAVSRCISELETHYGIRLFERIGRRLSVTEAGREFYHHALHIVDSFNRMESGMKGWDECGILRVGASITLGTFLLPKVMKQFRVLHPDIRLKATVANGSTLQDALLDNRLDFAVIEGGRMNERLQKEPLGADRLVPVLPPNDPRKGTVCPLKELASSSLLLREHGSAGRSFLDHLFSLHELPVEPVMESVSTQAILQAVHAGLGISFLPERLTIGSIRSGLVATCTVEGESLKRDHYLVYHKNKFHSCASRELMDLLRHMFEAQISENEMK